MTVFFNALAILLMLSISHGVQAQTRQEPGALRQTVEQFLQMQANGLPGQVNITVGAIDPRLNLPACAAPEAFFPNGSRAWGKTTVGVRCSTPASWTIYVSANVRVQGEYVVTATALAQGRSIGPEDITKAKGELTTLPAGVITDPAQAIGRTLSMGLAPGAPLRQDVLRNQQVIQQGQLVRLTSGGPGFQVSSEARALNNANEGQITQVRTTGGQVISGTAKLNGVVEVRY